MDKVGRNDPCPCGSGKKYKKCCEAAGGRKKFHAEVISSGTSPGSAVPGTKKVTSSLFKRALQAPIAPKPEEPKNPESQ